LIIRIFSAAATFLISSPSVFFLLYYGGGGIFTATFPSNHDAQLAFGVFIILPFLGVSLVSSFAFGFYAARWVYRKMNGTKISPDQISN
jgi:hypothetical protein